MTNSRSLAERLRSMAEYRQTLDLGDRRDLRSAADEIEAKTNENILLSVSLRKADAELERLQAVEGISCLKEQCQRDMREAAEARASRFERALETVAGVQWCEVVRQRERREVCPTCVAQQALDQERKGEGG